MNQTTVPKPGEDEQSPAGEFGYQMAVRIAAVTGVFSLVVCAMLFYDYSLRQAKDPHEAEMFKYLRLAVVRQPDNEELKEEIRRLDLRLRQEYFRRRAFAQRGGWLLLGGIAVFLVAAKTAATLRRRLPTPQPQTTPRDLETQWTRIARWSVAGLAVVLAAVALGLSVASRGELPEEARKLAALLEPGSIDVPNGRRVELPPPPSEQQIEKMWPCFRGPHGSGVSAYTNVPDSWDDASGKNILWKTPVPLPGMSSPVVWADRVFLSGASKDRREVYCLDT